MSYNVNWRPSDLIIAVFLFLHFASEQSLRQMKESMLMSAAQERAIFFESNFYINEWQADDIQIFSLQFKELTKASERNLRLHLRFERRALF